MDKSDVQDGIEPVAKYLYLLLYAPGSTGRACEPVRDTFFLQKSMYILSNAMRMSGLGFAPGDRGPYSPQLEAARSLAEASGTVDAPAGGPVGLTPRGRRAAEALWAGLSDDERETIIMTKEFANDMEYWELVSYVYSTFPETTGMSTIRDEFEARRLDAAVGLFCKEKISTGKAAEVAGISWDGFADELQRRGIPAYVQDYEHYKEAQKIIERITRHEHCKAP